MGLFKSVRDLNRQAKDISAGWDVGAQLEDAQARMAAMNQVMADQTAAANLALTGIDATATIAAVRQGAGLVNMQPLIQLDLTVLPEGRPPYPATVSQVVPMSHLALARPGATVRVKVDPNDASIVWIDWASTPM
jgi:hypothetical protein